MHSCSLVQDCCFHPEEEELDLGLKVLLLPESLGYGTVLPMEQSHKLPTLESSLYDLIKLGIHRGLKLRFPHFKVLQVHQEAADDLILQDPVSMPVTF